MESSSQRRARTWLRLFVAAWALVSSKPAVAQTEGAPLQLPEVKVVETTPLPGLGVGRARVPSNTRSVDEADFERLHPLTLADLLDQRIGSVTRNDAQNTPFHPDVKSRGFTASPVLGTPQG